MVAFPASDDLIDIDAGVTVAGWAGDRPVLSMASEGRRSPSVRARAFVFSDPRSRALIPLIEKMAPSDASIMITGETGTGKELVARHVHELSRRANRPFVAVNCGAFSESLIESELFGYEKGAFTGAIISRPGWFEAANGGTLFLDEIGDMPLSLQVKLLRVLQEREVVRLGARKAVPLDIRVIAATNVDLAEAVAAGRFREDLFYRLQVVTLPLLPLRERRADILPLARHFMRVYGDAIQTRRLDLSPSAEEALYAHAWPGNIRQLENTIHRAVLSCQEGYISVDDLALAKGARSTGVPGETENASLEEQIRPLLTRWFEEGQTKVLDRVVEAVVREAYFASDGNQIRAAALLGITRNVIRTHLKNLDLI